jgi:hypothetical protein
MTDEQLQEYANQDARLVVGGKVISGKLLTGFEAQVRVKAPYAIQWHDVNPTLGTNEERLAAIPHAEAVESIELIDESATAEIENEAEETQTPG